MISMTEKKPGKLISFSKASDTLIHAKKEIKLKKVQDSFKAATKESLKMARKQRSKRKNSKKKK